VTAGRPSSRRSARPAAASGEMGGTFRFGEMEKGTLENQSPIVASRVERDGRSFFNIGDRFFLT
jgi:hypothetical protein